MGHEAIEDTLGPVEIANNETGARWEATLDGDVVGFAEYKIKPGRVIFTHTEVDEAHEGQGIASKLARAALDDAVARELRITIYCPFFNSYVKRHTQYASSIDEPRRKA